MSRRGMSESCKHVSGEAFSAFGPRGPPPSDLGPSVVVRSTLPGPSPRSSAYLFVEFLPRVKLSDSLPSLSRSSIIKP
ncbi:hypothetical protein EVAR_41369_1 [Eumeta japonica]|uniref:Uncharacterized protein n=1 Tax=Eumeta variegata TaxID=151549 RepID=A0A4C1XPI0_EUMVA|nr:hypothetical protein EVAR_41369_1 [Eumeta japonica]